MIYVPQDTTFNKCYVIQSQGVIRGYDTIPRNNVSYNYRDYYMDNDYVYRDGSGTWSQYATLPTCIDSAEITNSYYYRVDFPMILLGFLILCIFCFYIPIKIFSKIFRKGVL